MQSPARFTGHDSRELLCRMHDGFFCQNPFRLMKLCFVILWAVVMSRTGVGACILASEPAESPTE